MVPKLTAANRADAPGATGPDEHAAGKLRALEREDEHDQVASRRYACGTAQYHPAQKGGVCDPREQGCDAHG